MRNLFILFFSMVTFSVVAQSRVSQSVIIKFHSVASIAAPSSALQKFVRDISTTTIQKTVGILPKKTPTNLLSTDSHPGLDRIIILPINKGLSADSISNILNGLEEIEYAEPNYIYHTDFAITYPNDSLYKEQWAHFEMEVPAAWKYTKGDSSVHIGFVDTGVEWDHPDLVGQFSCNRLEDINHNGLFDAWPMTVKHIDAHGNLVSGDLDGIDNDGNGYVDDVIGYDFIDQEFINFGDATIRDPFPEDEESHSHGTAVAGVIGAVSNNKIGISGIAPNCKLVALRALDATGNGESDDIASAIVYAADNGVQILNLSFGDIYSSNLLRDAIKYAFAKGVLIVASSGNDGGDKRHYPSDYDECFSVGQTGLDGNGSEYLDPSGTTHGEAMDILAPGRGILTLQTGNGYQNIGGTSFSAPATAAVAGLLLSLRPNLTNAQLKSIIESTTDDMLPLGYDHSHANGRVNARRALEFIGSALVVIDSPHTNDILKIGQPFQVHGSAASSLFKSYSLSYLRGLNPDADISNNIKWNEISYSDKQVIHANLGTWNTNGLQSGTYTLRLAMQTTDGRSVEEHLNIFLKSSDRIQASVSIDTIFYNERRALLITPHSDSLTSATLLYRPVTSGSWSAKNDENNTQGHAIVLTTSEVEGGVPLSLKIVLRDAAGDSISIDAVAAIPDESVSETGFIEKPYTLPGGYLLDSVISDTKGLHVVENVFNNGSFGTLAEFTFNAGSQKFIKTDSLLLSYIPRSIGNTSLSSTPQILLQLNLNATVVYEPNSSHSAFGNIILADSSAHKLFPTTFADIDGDGKDEICGYSNGNYEVLRVEASQMMLIDSLYNTTNPKPHYKYNQYNTFETIAADFLGNGSKQLAIIDDDADLILYKYDPTAAKKFTAFFVNANDGYTEGRNISSGDFNGDGRPDIALAYHRNYTANDDDEYDPSFWTVKVFFNEGNGNFTLAYVDNFYLARSNSPYRSSIGTVHNVTGSGKDELALSFFPNFYLLSYDEVISKIKPIWHSSLSNSPRSAISYDFDGNGKRELGFVAGDSIRFFERMYDLSTRTPTPAGLEVIPRDVNRVDLRWSTVDNAQKYYILRAANEQNPSFELIDSSTSNKYSDTSVIDGDVYLYSVQAYSTNYAIMISDACPALPAFVHPTPLLLSASDSLGFIRVITTQPIIERPLTGAEFSIDTTLTSTSAIIAGATSVMVRLSSPISGSEHTIQVTSSSFRDKWNSPFDTTQILIWNHAAPTPIEKFYILRWHFIASAKIEIEFSMRPDDNALSISNYTLSPYGAIVSAMRDPLNDSNIILTLGSSTNFRPIGGSFIVCVDHITSGLLELDATTGCVGETPIAETLDNLFVYPSPVKSSDESLTFAGLTAEADIVIFSQDLKVIRRLSTTERTGGVKWDLRDESGRVMPSGVYIYHVTGKDVNGKAVKPKESKFVMVRSN